LKLLLLAGKEIGSPEVKRMTIDVEGADGTLDYTEYFGEPKYNDVTHKFPFAIMEPKEDLLSHYSHVKNALHGKKMRIILDDEPDFFYVGRIYVQPFTSDRTIGYITIETECEPYKYKLAKTVVTRAIAGTVAITLTNARKRAVPEVSITTSTSLNIQYGSGLIWDLGPGSYTLPELELKEGDNFVTVTGTGSITFTWQEGEL
jgi:phage-related protein